VSQNDHEAIRVCREDCINNDLVFGEVFTVARGRVLPLARRCRCGGMCAGSRHMGLRNRGIPATGRAPVARGGCGGSGSIRSL
jgi:hypothetical protein